VTRAELMRRWQPAIELPDGTNKKEISTSSSR